LSNISDLKIKGLNIILHLTIIIRTVCLGAGTLKDSIKTKKVFLYTNACEKRRCDAKKFSKYFYENKFNIVNDPADADYIVFVTCAFLDIKIEECLEIIKKLQKYKGELIVAGCLPEIAKKQMREVFDGKTISTKDMDQIDEIFKEHKTKLKKLDDEHTTFDNYNPFGISKEPVGIVKRLIAESKTINRFYKYFQKIIMEKFRSISEIAPFDIFFRRSIERYVLIISRGCVHNCSYCGIRKAVGELKSKPLDECLKEFKQGLAQGYKLFSFQADDIGIYGLDIGSSLPELLNKITKIKGDYQISLHDTHPRWLVKYIDELEPIFKRKKIKEILVSTQSGSKRILKLMRRTGDKDEIIKTMHRMKKADPDLAIGVELIIGFPSETEEDFQETLDLLKRVKYGQGNIFAYSPTVDTDALKIEPKVSKKEVLRRMKVILKLLKNMNYNARYSRKLNAIIFKSR